MASIKLELSDCLGDSPQTRALIGVFENDAAVLTKYARGIQYAFDRITFAQSELTAATQVLSQHLREFDKQQFTLTNDNDYISSALKELAGKVDQISTFNAVLQTQIAENAAYHSSRFVEKYLSDIENLKEQFISTDKTHIEAMKRVAKLSKKRTNDATWQEASDHLHSARKGFHVTSMNYCSMLNLLQAHKKTGLLEPLIGFVQAQMGHFKMGTALCEEELENYLKNLQEGLKEVGNSAQQMDKENAVAIDRIDAESVRAYMPDPAPSMNFPELPVDKKRTQISGYLFARSTGMFMNQWLQRYYFTQGGNLMQQGRDDVAGSLVMDLDGCSIGYADTDDRRYLFQILSQDGKNSVILQAESNRDCCQWVTTIGNISKGLYLANDPERASELMQAAANPVEPSFDSAAPTVVQTESQTATSAKKKSQSDDFQSKHEQVKPFGMFARLKSAASSLVAPLNKDLDKAPNSEKDSSKNVTDGYSQDSAVSELEAVVNTGNHSILFDLPSPATQKYHGQSVQAKTADAKNGSLSDDKSAGESGSDPGFESNFNATHVVRFIGCREIQEDITNGYGVISESIRSIMAARALYNIFSMKELHMILTENAMTLVDPVSRLIHAWFAISEIMMTANHRENPRLIGVIIKRQPTSTDGGKGIICYVFESNSDGADVCCSIATAQVMVQSLVEQSEMQRQRELESDLEEQSRLLAQSSITHPKPVPAGNAETFEEEDLTMRDDE